MLRIIVLGTSSIPVTSWPLRLNPRPVALPQLEAIDPLVCDQYDFRSPQALPIGSKVVPFGGYLTGLSI